MRPLLYIYEFEVESTALVRELREVAAELAAFSPV